ncbi:hypothetical protein QVD17_10183 [Tagetes erecta]|uniref:Uncharacterized protein n=1 Tax=Tagetes erecta TaxID=13708 RepID=A0AAD8L2D4_TARER|nr:hypothetical protein QVD17_10183 [Tagetes erecta]
MESLWGGCGPESAPHGHTAPFPFGPELWGPIWCLPRASPRIFLTVTYVPFAAAVGADDGGRGSSTAICGSRCGNGGVKLGRRRGRLLLFRLPEPATTVVVVVESAS